MFKTIKLLIQRPISITLFITIIAIYQASYLNSTYYKQVLSALSIRGINDVVFCVIFILLNLFIWPRLIKLVASILILISTPVNYFMATYRIMIDRDMLQNALDTTQAESFTLITPGLIIEIILFGILPILLIVLVNIKPIKHWGLYLLRRLCSVILAVLLIVLVAALFYKNYAAFMRNNSGIIKYLTPSNYIAAIYNQYDYLKYKNLPFVELGDDAYQEPSANSNGQKM